MRHFKLILFICILSAVRSEIVFSEEPIWVLQSDLNFVANPAIDEKFYSASSVQWQSGLYLEAMAGKESSFGLAEQVPHTLKWEITFTLNHTGGWDTQIVRCSEKCFFIGAKGLLNEPGLVPLKQHTLTIERAGKTLSYVVDGGLSKILKISLDDRTALQAVSGMKDLTINQSRLYFNKGEELSAPIIVPEKAMPTKEPQWKECYREEFNSPDSAAQFLKVHGGEIQWYEKYKALLLRANETDENSDVYAVIHKSLPGDLRVRFKALRSKSATELNIGLLFSIRGALDLEEGYFVEWAHGFAQIKKHTHLEKRAEAPTPSTQDRWVSLELRRVGPAITMLMEGKIVLEWIDRHPITGSENDLFSFYLWSDQTLIDDIMIERNLNDPIMPLPDDPATEGNVLQSVRHPGMNGAIEGDF